MSRPVPTLLYVCLLVACPAFGARYEVEVDVDSEQDLYELLAREEISQTTFDTLVELFRDGVDLSADSREELYELPGLTYAEVDAILVYRQRKGRIEDPAELVAQGVITEETLKQIAAFLVVDGPARRPVAGDAELGANWANADDRPPPAYLAVRVRGPLDLSAGALGVFSRYAVTDARYDTTRDALSAPAPVLRGELPKFWLRWKVPQRQVLVGNFRLGFGQKLVLDNSARYAPDGLYPDDSVLVPRYLTGKCKLSQGELSQPPCTDAEQETHVTDDYDWREPFRGLAVRLEDLSLSGSAALTLTAFGSYQDYSAYQYELYDRRACPDPTDDANPACGSVPVYRRQSDALAAAPKITYSTFEGFYREAAGGGNATLRLGPHGHVGLTGYYAALSFPYAPLQVDLQEWARRPWGGPYGAVGLDGAVHLGAVDAFLEAARSFDSEAGGGGGWAGIGRGTYSFQKNELEVSLRYYQRAYNNPYSRALSSPDMLDGSRVRNEAGARLKYTGQPLSDLRVHAYVNAWMLPEGDGNNKAGTANAYAEVRADYFGWKQFDFGGWVDYRDKNLSRGGNGDCYLGDEVVVAGEPQPCSGEYYRGAVRVHVDPFRRKLEAALQAQLIWQSDPDYVDHLRQERVVWAELASHPAEDVSLRLRSRYRVQDAENDRHLETSLWSTLEGSWRLARRHRITLRYDVVAYLDKRDSTAKRIPNPEHRLRLELSTRF